ncbi:hypothetical protein [Citreimonas salinaria]|uniref:SpoIIAA-like n=1 Tax=Citreimonas salinaria TaxID=321339 RepID=A0A1H3FVY6_9RHOB|nr:hypothetical protein [Citreimonas salinaria]SDX95232.1 hypothetical protein SAMN05444340_10213 [Citreimonas salinaria]
MAYHPNHTACARSTLVATLETFEVRQLHGMFYIRQPRALGLETHQTFLDWLYGLGPEASLTPVIHDMRACDFDQIGTETVKAWVHQGSRNRSRRTTPRAIVVGSESAFGTMRMFQILSDARSVTDETKMLLTYSLAEAVRWLRHHRQSARLRRAAASGG